MTSLTPNTSPLAWEETAPGTFTRPLDTIERFFKWLADIGIPIKREHYSVFFALRLSLPSSLPASHAEPYLKRAWLILNKQHPMLHARADGNTITVSPPDEANLLSESFIIHSGPDVTVDTLFASVGPSPISRCHWLPHTRHLVIQGSHWRVDGTGSLRLADRLLTTLGAVIRAGDADAPLESYGVDLTPYLTPSLDDISGVHTDEETPAVKKVADDLFATVLKGAPSIGTPLTPGTERAVPGPSVRMCVTLDRDTTRKVVAECKRLGVKVTSAVHAAIVKAVAAYEQHPLARQYCITTAIDLRRRLPGGNRGDGPELFAGMFISPGLVLIEEPGAGGEGRGFEALAGEFDRTYGADMSRMYDAGDGEAVSVVEATAPFARRIVPLLQMPMPEGLPPQNTPNLSSIGVMETYLKREFVVDGEKGTKVEVEDVWMGCDIVTPAICCHLWTWRDELTLGGIFNEAYYEEEFVRQFMESVKDILLEGLGV